MRGRPKQFERDAALAKAVEVFWERGYDATSLSDLTAGMGIGRQSLYNTFGDKRALFLEVIRHYLEENQRPVLQALGAEGSALENLRTVISSWRGACDRPDRRGCLLVNSVSELAGRDEEIKLLLRDSMERLEGGFAAAVRRAQDAGELSRDREAHAIAQSLVTVLNGLMVLHRLPAEPTWVDSSVTTALDLLR